MTGELIHRSNAVVASRFVSYQLFLERSLAGQPPTERLREHLGIDECVTDALRGDRIFVVLASPTSAHPLPVRLAEVARHACRAVPLFFATALAHASREVGAESSARRDVPLNVGAHDRKVLGRPVHHHEMETIVGRRATEGVVVPGMYSSISSCLTPLRYE